MKKTLSILTLLAAAATAANAASFTAGDLVVLRVGDGSTALANSAGPISFLELSSLGSTVQSVAVPSGSGGLQVSGTATSEGQIVLNADGTSVSVAGYLPPFGGSGSLSSRSAANAPRGYAALNFDGTVSAVTGVHNSSAYSGQNIRSAFTSGSGTWTSGSGTSTAQGLVYDDGTTAASIQGINSRVLGYRNGDLYYSTGSGTTGIYKYSGLPTAASTASTFLTGVAGQGVSPYDFIFSPDGNSLYVADSGIGVQKFTFDGSAWSLAFNLTGAISGSDRAYGLAVDFSGSNPLVYWSTPTDIWKATDLGVAAAGTSIATAGANYAFRGLELVTQVPEPTALSLAGVGLAVLIFRQRVVARR